MAIHALNPVKHDKSGRVLWIDYLRSFITVLVVAHHSSLAYTTFARASPLAYIRSSAPIVDIQRWVGLDIFENFNDVFFMALMFLIGGIFVVKALQKKGLASFIRERFYRLFLPFLIVISTLMLLAYYPAYRNMHPDGSLRDFLNDFISIEGWPPGPPWFIWVLFLFNLILALFSEFNITWLSKVGIKLQGLKDRPYVAALLFFMIAWILYVPASWLFGPYTWTGFGPFVFQKSRFLLYFGFFLTGCIIGSPDPNEGIFSSGSALVKKWRLWTAGCIFFYLILISLEYYFPHGGGVKAIGLWPSRFIYSSVYTLSTCFSCLAFLTLFKRFATRPAAIWNSLSNNAYCIYLVHYVFVLWCQYGLLGISLPAIVKFGITFVLSISFSWIVSMLLRKIPVVKAYV
jgi:glucans biosynthesis protein C